MEFAKKQFDVVRYCMPRLQIIIKLHASQINNLLKGQAEIKEIMEDYSAFMKGFLRCLISSLFKTLTLKKMNADELNILRSLEGIIDPFKIDIDKEFTTTSLYYVLADNIWREYLGWSVPKLLYERVNVEGFKNVFRAFMKALSEDYKIENNKKAAQKLTEFSLDLFGVKIIKLADEKKTSKYTV